MEPRALLHEIGAGIEGLFLHRLDFASDLLAQMDLSSGRRSPAENEEGPLCVGVYESDVLPFPLGDPQLGMKVRTLPEEAKQEVDLDHRPHQARSCDRRRALELAVESLERATARDAEG
jgi:hypothetical protein